MFQLFARRSTAIIVAGMIAMTFTLARGPLPAAAQSDRPFKIVALGDSLTAGFGVSARDAFPAQLARALAMPGRKIEIVNAGVSSDTASNGLSRLDWSVPEDADAVIVELGANDMLRGLNPTLTRAALAQILDRLTARNIPILLCGMRAAPNLGGTYARDFEAMFQDLARAYANKNVLFYPFFLDGVAADPKLNQPDGLHPNSAGVAVIVARIRPSVDDLIAHIISRKP